MKKLLVHADDFGISPSVNDAIVALGEQKRLSGTAVMTIFEESRYKADELMAIENFAIGLHITLTDQPLCHYNSSLINAAGHAYGVKDVIQKATKNQLDVQDLEAEIRMQLDNFYTIFKRYPDYFDGHHHVQLLKPVRKALYNVTSALGINVYIRSANMPYAFGLSPKTLVLRGLNKDMQTDIQEYGWQSNTYFAGSYGKEGIRAYFDKILSKQKDDLLMMVHPGFVDDILASRDPFTDGRIAEYNYLNSDAFSQTLQKYGYYVG
ncbi:MAG: ChbG/HpnK family deacetylase [Alphaproteobacteria bacterium]